MKLFIYFPPFVSASSKSLSMFPLQQCLKIEPSTAILKKNEQKAMLWYLARFVHLIDLSESSKTISHHALFLFHRIRSSAWCFLLGLCMQLSKSIFDCSVICGESYNLSSKQSYDQDDYYTITIHTRRK